MMICCDLILNMLFNEKTKIDIVFTNVSLICGFGSTLQDMNNSVKFRFYYDKHTFLV